MYPEKRGPGVMDNIQILIHGVSTFSSLLDGPEMQNC
jgi:hypothetical protein